MAELGNHLWQSTIFAFAIASLCLLLRRHSPRLRYWLLLAASVKFLVPVSVFMAVGAQLQTSVAEPVFTAIAVEQATAAFAPIPSSLPAPARQTPWHAWVWAAGTVTVLAWRMAQWRKLDAIRRSATPIPLAFPVPVLMTPTLIEPGIFGVFRSTLLVPEGLLGDLSAAQLQAILAHERCHLRYRDNLTAAIHGAVEALFWFHPLVWWIGVRLIDERERHCDESVIANGNDARAYAQGIVTVCRQYLSSPLPWAAGVSGSDLKRRIAGIMSRRMSRRLTFTGKVALAGGALGALSVPFVIGALRAQTLPPPPKYHFEVASIKPSNAPDNSNRVGSTPQGGFRAQNATVTQMIAMAFGVRPFLIADAPTWASSQRWDVVATPNSAEDRAAEAGGQQLESPRERFRQRVQSLLIDRFGLVIRPEKRVMPVYKLVIARGGHKLAAATAQDVRRMESNSTMLRGTAVDMQTLADSLAGILGRPVLDETNLSGDFNLSIQFADQRLQAKPEEIGNGAADPAGTPTLYNAMSGQLGLRLESARAPAPVFVVERVRKPTEN